MDHGAWARGLRCSKTPGLIASPTGRGRQEPHPRRTCYGPNLGAFVGKLPRHKAVLCACRTIPERESIWDTELEGWDLEQTGLPTQGIKSTTDKFSRNLESSSSLGHGQR